MLYKSTELCGCQKQIWNLLNEVHLNLEYQENNFKEADL